MITFNRILLMCTRFMDMFIYYLSLCIWKFRLYRTSVHSRAYLSILVIAGYDACSLLSDWNSHVRFVVGFFCLFYPIKEWSSLHLRPSFVNVPLVWGTFVCLLSFISFVFGCITPAVLILSILTGLWASGALIWSSRFCAKSTHHFAFPELAKCCYLEQIPLILHPYIFSSFYFWKGYSLNFS